MRLLNTSNFEVKLFGDGEVPPYAILSHTWGEEEVTIQDMEGTHAANKKGYEKVEQCCSIARANGFDYVWIDTCCIDKASSAELSEAINSMYRWYQEAKECYAYLADVPSISKFSGSRWFTRGWTLQELIAPPTVIFFDKEWKKLGTKETLRQVVSNCTGIPVGILLGDDDLDTFSIAQRMSWSAKRKTSRIEDRAYCLLGIFGINMPLVYGEREAAFIRLQEEIMRVSDDHSLFAWKSSDDRGGLLATSPASFINSYNIIQFYPLGTFNSPLSVSSRGIHLELRFIGWGRRGLGLAILHCKERGGQDKMIAIYVRDLNLTMERFERVQSEEFEQFDLSKFKPSQYPVRRICIQIGRMTRMRKSKDCRKCDRIPPEEIYPNSTQTTLMKFGVPTRLLRAAEKGLEDDVWLMLTRSDIEANLKDINGQTALSLTARYGHEVVVKLLLDKGVDLEAKDKDNGQTPLLWAAQYGHEAVVELLLNTGADLEAKDNDNSQTPLLWAAKEGHEAVVKLLLDKGADLKARDKNGQTPLSWAAEKGHEAVIKLLLKLLLDKSVDLEAKDKNNGQTPLSLAARYGHEAVVKLLFDKGADLEAKDKNGQTPLSWATQKGHGAVVKLLLDK
ncbi:ankyrin, partial [Zopfia rhizophila CBS 207.26]